MTAGRSPLKHQRCWNGPRTFPIESKVGSSIQFSWLDMPRLQHWRLTAKPLSFPAKMVIDAIQNWSSAFELLRRIIVES